MIDPNCVFCKIIKNEIPVKKYYEDDKFLAVFDIKPISPDHIVLMSKNHYTHTSDMPNSDWQEFILKAKELAETHLKEIEADGYNLLINEGEAAQSMVAHRPHCHIIFRKIDDGIKIDPR